MSFPTQITVSPVSGSRQLSLFIKLPRQIYDGLPGYVAPLDMEERDMLSPKNRVFSTTALPVTFWHGVMANRLAAYLPR